VKGEVVVYASGDAAVRIDVIPALVETLRENPQFGAVIAHVTPLNHRGIMGRISSLIWELFNGVSQELDNKSRLAQANDLYAFRRDLVTAIPQGTINDDTFIATAIRRQGFLVKKSNFEVMISGPTTPLDYVIQRSRIVTGHLQTIRKQRAVPTVFEFTLLSSPIRSLGILASTTAGHGLGYFVPLIVALNLELVTWVHAMFGALSKRDVSIWEIAQGTKELSRYVKR